MSHKGYGLEHEVEQWLLKIEEHTADTPMDDRSYRVPSSGAMTSLSGDVRSRIKWLPKQIIFECKARKNSSKKERSLRLEKIWLDKNRQEAEKENRLSIVVVSFKQTPDNRLHAVIPLDHLKELLEWIKQKPVQGKVED